MATTTPAAPEPDPDADLGGRRRSLRVREAKARRPPTPVLSDSPPSPPPVSKKEKTPKKMKKEKEVKTPKKRGKKGNVSESPSDEDDLSDLQNESEDDGMWLVTQKTLLDDDFTPEEDSADEDFKPRGRNFQRQAKRASEFDFVLIDFE